MVSRILLINPNTSDEMTAKMADAVRAANLPPGTAVDTVKAEFGPRYIEGDVDEAVAALAVADLVAARVRDYDAFVIGCFSDPGLRAARELSHRPVVGIAEASFLLAHGLGAGFSILSTAPEDGPVFRRLVRSYGLGGSLVSIRPAGVTIEELAKSDPKALPSLLGAGRQAVADGAGALCLACAGMSGLAGPLAKELGVPVLDPVLSGLALASLYLGLGLSHPAPNIFVKGRRREYTAGFGRALQEVYEGSYEGR